MFCPQCGAQLPDGSRFCGKCGAQIDGAASVPGGQPGADGPVVTTPPKKGLDPRVKVGIIAVVAVAVVAAIIWGVVSCVGGGGRGSAQDVANGLTAAFDKIVDDNFSSDSINGAMDDLLDLMPQKVVEQELNDQGLTREELIDQMGGMMGIMDLEQFQDYMSMLDVSISTSVSDPLSSDELASVNSALSPYGLTASEGNQLVMTMTVSALGQTQSQDLDTFCAVKIDGGWYLWGL